ncbi:hypothetical protein AYO41_05215 [Verrucomicrobia bacterium SCGC AG-212-E04]|nr:hypothetical protein AYO41_05215 [Verrucomicrobia bacterium SCGC AG-212-E04]
MKRWSGTATWIARVALAGVFLWAGAQKARRPELFALDLEAYRILPAPVILPIAYYLPWLEIFTALALFVPSLRRAAGWLALGLLGIFTAMLVIAWSRGLQINCGCFGAAGQAATDFALAIARNAVLLVIAAWLLRMESVRRRA